MAEMNIIYELLDYWLYDPIDRGSKPLMLYIIYKIADKIYVKWEEVNDY